MGSGAFDEVWPLAKAPHPVRARTTPPPKFIFPKRQKANSTLRASRAVPHPSTDRAFRRLTSEFGWDRVYSTKYGRWRKQLLPAEQKSGHKKKPSQKRKNFNWLMKCYPKGFATLGESAMLRRQVRRATGKPRGHRSPRKIDVTGKLTVASVSVVTLIRTDTTLDHSQKAEKV